MEEPVSNEKVSKKRFGAFLLGDIYRIRCARFYSWRFVFLNVNALDI